MRRSLLVLVFGAGALVAPLACGPLDGLVACDVDDDCPEEQVCGAGFFCRPPASSGEIDLDGGGLDGGGLPPPPIGGQGCRWVVSRSADDDGESAEGSWLCFFDAGIVNPPGTTSNLTSGRPADAGPSGGPFPDAGPPGPLDDGRSDAGPPDLPPPPPVDELDDGRSCSEPDGGLAPDASFTCPEEPG